MYVNKNFIKPKLSWMIKKESTKQYLKDKDNWWHSRWVIKYKHYY
jgi:hypothetical protein